MISRTLSSRLLMLSLIAEAHAESQYQQYKNDRFGFVVDVPKGWSPGEEPANNDGLVFTSRANNSMLRTFGHLNNSGSLKEALGVEREPADGETVTYRSYAKGVFVQSGTRGDTIFYRKATTSRAGKVIVHVELEYPKAGKGDFDAIVTHVAGSLRGGRGWQIRDCR